MDAEIPAVKTLVDAVAPSPKASLAVAWIDGKSSGRQVVTNDTTITESTMFEIGSVTKGLTGIAFAQLISSGSIDPSTSLVDLLPFESPERFEHLRPVTLEGLATHRSGLPRLPNLGARYAWRNRRDPYANVTEERLAKALAKTKLNSETNGLYSNLGFGLLGWLLARHESTDFGGLMTRLVLDRLDMADTIFLEKGSTAADMAPALTAKGESGNYWTFRDTTAGAGGLGSTLADMAKLLQAVLAPHQNPLGPAITMATEPLVDFDEDNDIGFGWLTTESSGINPVTWHNGQTGSFTSFLGVNRVRGTGVVLLLNEPKPEAVTTAGMRFLRGSEHTGSTNEVH